MRAQRVCAQKRAAVQWLWRAHAARMARGGARLARVSGARGGEAGAAHAAIAV